jgi:hypothetical protein
MFSRQDLQELAEYKGTRGPVLSLYLNVDPSQHTTDEYDCPAPTVARRGCAASRRSRHCRRRALFDLE